MIYPTLPLSATAISIFEKGLSPYFDIVWSLTYHVDGFTADDELGICMFLQDASQPLSGGGVGVDLGYSGLSAYNETLSATMGMLSGVVGIGLDSTGQFPLSVQWPDGTKRNGLNVADRIMNSVSVRGSYPDYFYLSGSNTAITDFDIIESEKKTLRARLGNYGRTIYLDYRRSDSDRFTNILTQDIDINFNESTRFRPGVSFVKPVSSINSSTQQVIIETFHIEGRDETPVFDSFEFTPITIFSYNSALPVDIGDLAAATPPLREVSPVPPLPPIELPRPLPKTEYNCGDIITATRDGDITSYTVSISGDTGNIPIAFVLPEAPLSATTVIPISAATYRFETLSGTNYGALSVSFLSSYRDEFASYGLVEGSAIIFPYLSNLTLIVNNLPLTITGFRNYYDLCTLWIEESGNIGTVAEAVTGTYCAAYSPTFTIVLTGDYKYNGYPSGTRIASPSSYMLKIEKDDKIPTPIRFTLDYDDNPIFYDTGYIGSSAYDINGKYRDIFIHSISSNPLSSDFLDNLPDNSFAADGYPLVVQIDSIAKNYVKPSDTVRITSNVFNPLSGKDWAMTVQCPTTATETCVSFNLDRTVCIAVIDESDDTAAAVIQADWNIFRRDYPNRPFYILQPSLDEPFDLQLPGNFDGTVIQVSRDDGVKVNRTDWFEVLGLSSLPAGSYVALSIDNSGSMFTDTVLASYNYFKERLNAAGLNLLQLDMGSTENWVNPFNIIFADIPRSAPTFVKPITICSGLATTTLLDIDAPSSGVPLSAVPPNNITYRFSDSGGGEDLGRRRFILRPQPRTTSQTIPLEPGSTGVIDINFIATLGALDSISVYHDGVSIPPVDDKRYTFTKVASANDLQVDIVSTPYVYKKRAYIKVSQFFYRYPSWTFTLNFSGSA